MKRFLCALVLLLSAAAPVSAGGMFEGVVRAVYDGDTILLATRAQDRLMVRLYGIDAPEAAVPEGPGQPFGAVARRVLMYKVMGRQVLVEPIDGDRYQRMVAVIRFDGRDINREMVAEGMAWAYRRYLDGAHAPEYIAAEEFARKRHKGLWRDASPQPPWEFRQSTKGATRRRRP